MLNISPLKGVTKFTKRVKLDPRYIGPFEILVTIGLVAYKLKLPREIINVHDTFHTSNHKKCFSNNTLAIPLDETQINSKLHFEEDILKNQLI